MGSRIFNFIANKWTTSPGKKTTSGVDHLSGTSTPTATTTASTTATSVHEESSSPPSSVDESGAVADEVKMESEKEDGTNMELGNEVQQQEEKEEDEDDTEGMDMKAKALTKLLQTSSVGSI
jgi:ATP-dependent DNA helicase